MWEHRRVLYPSADGTDQQPGRKRRDHQLVACDVDGKPFVPIYASENDWEMRELYKRILEQPRNGIDSRHLRALELSILWEDELPQLRNGSLRLATRSLREVSRLLYDEGIWVEETKLPWYANQVRDARRYACRPLLEEYFLRGQGKVYWHAWMSAMKRLRGLSEGSMWKLFRDNFYDAMMGRE